MPSRCSRYNIRSLLMQPPLVGRRVLAIDPGFRTGCKLAALDEFGNLLDHTIIYPHGGGPSGKKWKDKEKKPSPAPATSPTAPAAGPGAEQSAPAPEVAAAQTAPPDAGATTAPAPGSRRYGDSDAGSRRPRQHLARSRRRADSDTGCDTCIGTCSSDHRRSRTGRAAGGQTRRGEDQVRGVRQEAQSQHHRPGQWHRLPGDRRSHRRHYRDEFAGAFLRDCLGGWCERLLGQPAGEGGVPASRRDRRAQPPLR